MQHKHETLQIVLSEEPETTALTTIDALLRYQFERMPDRVAVVTPGRMPLTYRGLCESLDSIGQDLWDFGLGRNDRVAVVLPMGTELALTFLAVAAAGQTFAPLNPTYSAGEFEYYLTDLRAKAVVAATDIDSPVRDVAVKLGIHLIELPPYLDVTAGTGCLAAERRPGLVDHRLASADDVALVLYTSGTTSRPKMVPLTHANLCASARNIQTTLHLSESDCCLNLMPQFHIHGLMVTLASLAAGGSIASPRQFDVTQFVSWLQELEPTWYSAVPTIHQAILARLRRHPPEVGGHRLRFIRSASAPLPQTVAAGLESLFGVPVIEAYGMTEAAHQISSNLLPPGLRKPGSVGVGVGVDVAIMDQGSMILPRSVSGEIVLRGPNLMRGYEENSEANAAAFVQGWFRTGDQGFLDEDGYLFIDGRLKEMINRGGEKVWPQEVDDVLMDHPAVAQVLAFALPHPTLGETVAAAVVLWENASVTEGDLREFAAGRLAHFKVPERIVFVDAIPRGATGKLQRIGLAEKLGIGGGVQSDSNGTGLLPQPVAPRTLLEEQLAQIWEEILDIRPVGMRDDFFTLGGHSLLAARMIDAIERTCHQRLPTSILLESSTIEQLARLITQESPEAFRRPLTALQPDGSRPPFFFLHGDWDGGGHYCINLARHLGPEQPFYAVHPHGHDDRLVPPTIEAMAAEHLEAIRQVRPRGPYLLGGYCNGALMAYEMACRLRSLGEEVLLVALIDVNSTNVRLEFRALGALVDRLAALRGIESEGRRDLFMRLRAPLLAVEVQCKRLEARFERLRELAVAGTGAQAEYARRKIREVARWLRGVLGPYGKTLSGEGTAQPNPLPYRDTGARFSQIDRIYVRAIASYRHPRYPGRIVLFQSAQRGAAGLKRIWGRLVDEVEVQVVPGTHNQIITKDVQDLAQRLQECLQRAQAKTSRS